MIRSKNVVLPDGVREASIVIREGKIADIGAYDATPPENAQVVDVGSLHVMAGARFIFFFSSLRSLITRIGVVDSHVHVNEPGREAWEGFETATKAAAAGGTEIGVVSH